MVATVVDTPDHVLHHDKGPAGQLSGIVVDDLTDDAGEAGDQLPVVSTGAEHPEVSKGRGCHTDDVAGSELCGGLCHISWSPSRPRP
jgi:hypothetical protein